jgi:hypothetical protein
MVKGAGFDAQVCRLRPKYAIRSQRGERRISQL